MTTPASDIFTLLYVSSLAPHARISDVTDIARKSRPRNARADITGLLVFDGSSFAQMVEGPREAIKALRARLADDRRHVDMDVLVFDRSDDERRFANWELGYHFADHDGGELSALRGLRGAVALATFEALRPSVDTLAGVAMPVT